MLKRSLLRSPVWPALGAVTLMTFAGCGSGSGGSGSGGSGSGGAIGAGGATAVGGATGTGGATRPDAAVSTGGTIGVDAPLSTGGAMGVDAAISTGGATGVDGSVSTGGAMGLDGGATASVDAGVVLPCGPEPGVQPGSPWPMRSRCRSHQARADVPGPKAGKVKWSFTTGDRIFSSPVIAADGTVYIGSNDQSLYAIDSTGNKKWSFATGGAIQGVPAIGTDGTVYVGSDVGLYAVTPGGAMKWTVAVSSDSEFFTDVTLGADGTIYSVCSNGNVHAFSPAGGEKWLAQFAKASFAPAIDTDGTLYLAVDPTFAALKSDGSTAWSIDTAQFYLRTTTLAPGGIVYAPDGQAVRARRVVDGSVMWSFAMASNTDSAVSIGPDGMLYIGNASSTENRVYAITPSGQEKWHYGTSARVFSTPAIGSDGSVYVGLDDMLQDNFMALNADGTLRFKLSLGPITGSPAIGSDGTVYVGAKDGKLYAIAD